MSRCPDCGKFCVMRERRIPLKGPLKELTKTGLRYYYHCPRCKKDFEATTCPHCGGPMPGEEMT